MFNKQYRYLNIANTRWFHRFHFFFKKEQKVQPFRYHSDLYVKGTYRQINPVLVKMLFRVVSLCKAAQVSPEAVLRSVQAAAAERFLGQQKDYTHIHKDDQWEGRSNMNPASLLLWLALPLIIDVTGQLLTWPSV